MFGAPAKVLLLALTAELLLSSVDMRAAESTTNSALAQFNFEFRQGNLMVPLRINDSKQLAFKLDTGFGVTTIHPELVESLQLNRMGTITIIGIAGEEESTTYRGAKFDFSGVTYSPRYVVAIPSEAKRQRRTRDGILGAGFFRRFVVEIDPEKRVMTLHDPEKFTYSGRGEVVPLSFRKDTPIVEAAINFTNRESVQARYEIDSGCDGELCLGHDFVKNNRLDEDTGTGGRGARSGVGGSVGTRHGVLPEFQLGQQKLERLPANFFQNGSPVGEGLAGHIGMGTLRHFKVIFDYSRRRMILELLK